MNLIRLPLSYLLVLLLLGTGLYFTLRFRLLQLRALPHSLQILRQKANHVGITSFQAFALGLASRTGTGNIAGVAVALTTGGPGAVFWMWFSTLLGMALAFVEATLAQIFKVPHDDQTFRGGPAYYIRFGLNSRSLSVLFALTLIVTVGFAFVSVQANSIADALDHAWGWHPALTGLMLALITAPIIFGGMRRVAVVSSRIVPMMALIYVTLATYVVVQHLPELSALISLIVKSAFGLQPAAGGLAGYAVSQAMVTGIKRALYASEAGMGKAPNSAATATTHHPVTQGLLQMLGVAIDTFVICSATAFMILASGEYEAGAMMEGAALTQRALASSVGSWGNGFMAMAIFFFAWTTILSDYAFAESNLQFLSRQPLALRLFRLTVLGVIIVGSLSSLPHVWQIADISMAVMAIINIIAIVPLSRYALAAWQDYQAQRRNSVRMPVFNLASLPELANKLPQNIWNGAVMPIAETGQLAQAQADTLRHQQQAYFPGLNVDAQLTAEPMLSAVDISSPLPTDNCSATSNA